MERIASLCLLSCAAVYAQTASTGPAIAKGNCNIVVSGSGNTISIRTCGMTKDEVDEWRRSFRQILAKQVDPKVVVALLDDIKGGQIRIENGVLRIESKLASMKERYSVDGEKVVELGPGQLQRQDGEHAVDLQILDAYNKQQWSLLVDICEKEIARVPGWLTPHEFLAAAYAHLRQKEKAITELQYLIDRAGGNPDFTAVAEECRQFIGILQREIAQGIL